MKKTRSQAKLLQRLLEATAKRFLVTVIVASGHIGKKFNRPGVVSLQQIPDSRQTTKIRPRKQTFGQTGFW